MRLRTYDHILSFTGTWNAATRFDSNGTVTAISAAAPDGTIHVDGATLGIGI